jgi:hypothetical protein
MMLYADDTTVLFRDFIKIFVYKEAILKSIFYGFYATSDNFFFI